MLVKGWDIRQWVIDALQAAGYSAKPSCPPDQVAENVMAGEREAIFYEQEQEQSVPPIVPSLDNERFMSYVRRIANSLPVPCTIVLQPTGYTIADQARETVLEEVERMKARRMITPSTS